MNILISACLLGINCRYDGKSNKLDGIEELMSKHTFIPICPEQLGGLKTPRVAAEIKDNKVVNKDLEDVTEEFEKGASEALKFAKLYNCKYAILKERSPSCGNGRIYDGTFSKTLIDGDGVTAKLLKENGLEIIGESKALNFLKNY